MSVIPEYLVGPDSGTTLVEGYVHGNEHILLRSNAQSRWLPIDHTDRDLIRVDIHDCPEEKSTTNDTQKHHNITILKLIAETTTMLSDNSKLLQVDFCWCSEEKPIMA